MSRSLVEVVVPPTEMVDPKLLKLDGDNPNRMTEKQRAALRDSIIKYGFIIPIITNEDLLVADGQQRLEEAVKTFKMEKVPVIRLPVKDVDRRILRQVLNKLKGEHQEDLDAQEFLRIVEAGERETLQKLIQISDKDLEESIKSANDVKPTAEKEEP